MTPQAFCVLVKPHLPIGQYSKIAESSDTSFAEVSIFSRGIGEWIELDSDDAARLLVGAIVEESRDKWCSIEVGTVSKKQTTVGIAVTLDHTLFGHGDGTDIFAILCAALAARAEARKERT